MVKEQLGVNSSSVAWLGCDCFLVGDRLAVGNVPNLETGR